MTQDMKHTIQTIMLLVVLIIGATAAWGQEIEEGYYLISSLSRTDGTYYIASPNGNDKDAYVSTSSNYLGVVWHIQKANKPTNGLQYYTIKSALNENIRLCFNNNCDKVRTYLSSKVNNKENTNFTFQDVEGGGQRIVNYRCTYNAADICISNAETKPNTTIGITDNSDILIPVLCTNKSSRWQLQKQTITQNTLSDVQLVSETSTMIDAAGTYTYTAKAVYGDSWNGNYLPSANEDGVTYTWQIPASLPSGVTITSSGSGLTVTLASAPATTELINVVCKASKGGLEKQMTVSILLYKEGDSGAGFTEINSLSDITNMLGRYKLSDDIDASGFAGLGNFAGILDGQNHKITNLSVPLCDEVNCASIHNLNIENVNISSSGNVGAIARVASGHSRIYNIGILGGTVSGGNYVGGIIGWLKDKSRVINCFSYANITNGSYVGGIVGYNNVATTSANLKTMVMNCMFYGDITGGSSKAPIYNGQIITNRSDQNGVSNFNYFCGEASFVQNRLIDTEAYNCALMAEKRFLQRFEFFRHLLNGHRELAAWWVTGNYDDKDKMLKWVMDPAKFNSDTPYPILMPPLDETGKVIKYPSVVNYTPSDEAIDEDNVYRNKGRKLTNMGTQGKLSVTIRLDSNTPYDAPSSGVGFKSGIANPFDLTITDKDPEHYNFNYGKVQLPYYNDYCTGNYTGYRVVTGWKIVEIDGDTEGVGSYSAGEDVTFNADGTLKTTPYNFADRKSTKKDLYGVSGRVFNQGAYWDVPDGVKSIVIAPYWAKAAYLADSHADVVYKQDMSGSANVSNVGGGQIFTNNNSSTRHGLNQKVYTSVTNARDALYKDESGNAISSDTYKNHKVYDYAIVLVGNAHNIGVSSKDVNQPYSIMSADFDCDNEPDYSYILRYDSRCPTHPVRVDFLNIPGLGMAQKSTGGTGTYNFGIMQPLGWFESTNTSLFRVTQFEYDNKDRVAAPYIVQGGIMEQWVSGQSGGAANNTIYFHVGGNVWFKEFHRGCHQDSQLGSKHPPVSVTGGDYDQFYLTGLYKAYTSYNDNAECYITGGRLGIVAGTGLEGIGNATNHTKGNITWQIDHADISEFYGGGINAATASLVQGNITTFITGSYVDQFCGGPKFGDMQPGCTVKTTASNCTFGTYFGAGYGGNSYSRQAPFNYSSNLVNMNTWNKWVNGEISAETDANFNGYKQDYKNMNYKRGIFEGVSTQFSYQFLPVSGNTTNVARLFIEYVKFSLAKTKDVTSTLTNCKISGSFYGGGNLGKVEGPVTSTLNNCIVDGDVFGAGYGDKLPIVEVMNTGGFKTEPYYDSNLGVYLEGKFPDTVPYTWDHHDVVNSTDNAIDKVNHILYTTENLKDLGTVEGNVILNIIGDDTHIMGDVYGGGAKAKSNGDYYKQTSPVLTTKTTVNLLGGTIEGNAYGGGFGYLGKKKASNPSEYEEDPIAADVGIVALNLNGVDYSAENKDLYESWGLTHTADTDPYTVPDNAKGCIVKGNIFGCNNLNGTPKGNVTVHVYGTQNADKEAIGEKYGISEMDETVTTDYGKLQYWIAQAEKNGVSEETINTAKALTDAATSEAINAQITILQSATETAAASHANDKYDVKAVYGGGNLAPYMPTNALLDYNVAANKETVNATFAEVIIDGCNRASIKQVYGGGNAASTPATSVTVKGAYEIDELFGGGNGKDAIDANTPNLGANVGYTNYSYYDTSDNKIKDYDGTIDGKPSAVTKEDRQSNYAYGSGKAAVNIFGGKIHKVFGGSNTRGNVRQTAVTMLDNRDDCDYFIIDEAYGGGKSAPMDAKAQLLMACIPGLMAAYGGAQEADILGDVELNITNGTFDRIFGGNNLSGTIHGSITVNIEETGCQPIIIGELYGGGNEAAYSVYGYKKVMVGEDEVWKPRVSLDDDKDDNNQDAIELSTALDANNNPTKYKNEPTVNAKSFTSIGDIYGGGLGETAVMVGNPIVNINVTKGRWANDNKSVLGNNATTKGGYPVPPHLKNQIGAINNVFGGGNAAMVIGNTTVNIGTEPTVEQTKLGDDYLPVLDTNGDPTSETKTVEGANIIGNVYGGGNQAEVTGSTNVTIGKQTTP